MAVLDKLSVPMRDGTTQGTLMPKLQYRFRVNFINLGEDNNTNVATNNVISVTKPSLSHDEVMLDVYNSRIYLAGKHAWEPVTIEFRDEITSAVTTLLDKQISRQIDMATHSSPEAGTAYKFEVEIDNLDGSTDNPDVLDRWVLQSCYIMNINYNESNYSSGSDVQTISVQIKYDNAAHLVNGTDILGTPPPIIGDGQIATSGTSAITGPAAAPPGT